MMKSHDTRKSLFILLGSAQVLESDYLLLRYRIGIATMLEKLKKGEREKDKALATVTSRYTTTMTLCSLNNKHVNPNL